MTLPTDNAIYMFISLLIESYTEFSTKLIANLYIGSLTEYVTDSSTEFVIE